MMLDSMERHAIEDMEVLKQGLKQNVKEAVEAITDTSARAVLENLIAEL